MVLITVSWTLWTSIHSSSGILWNLIPWIYLSLPLYNGKGFDLGHTWMAWCFPYFLQFKSEFCNREFMIWVTVSSWSYFCWLYRASPSSNAKNIIRYRYWPSGDVQCRVVSCVVGRECLLWPVCSLGKMVSLCPASFCTPRPNFPATPGISWLPTFAFQPPMMKRTSFWGVSSIRSCRSPQNHSTSALSALLVGA